MPASLFKSERINNQRSIFKKWLRYSLLVSIPVCIAFLFPQLHWFIQKDRNFWIIMTCVLSLQALIRFIQEDAINEIAIDARKRQVQFQFYDDNRGQVTETISFDTLQIKINRLIWVKNGNVNAIYFFTAKRKMFEITKAKDGFSTETINSLSLALESLTSPVK